MQGGVLAGLLMTLCAKDMMGMSVVESLWSHYAMQKYLKKQLYQGWLLQQCGAVYANWLCVRSAMEYT